MRTTSEQMSALSARLESAGFSRRFGRSCVLPEWWDDKIAESAAGYAPALTILSRHLLLDQASAAGTGSLLLRDPAGTRFKILKDVQERAPQPARCVATRAAMLACRAARTTVGEIPPTATAVRAAVGARAVSLPMLLDYCWSLGIAVAHVGRLPAGKGLRKMDALAIHWDSRYAVALCRNDHHEAVQLFHLAHELGHICLEHLAGPGACLVEQGIDPDSTDAQEVEANAFAGEVLTGRPDVQYKAREKRLTGPKLAESATRVGERDGVDPGVVALNYAWTEGQWGAGMAALKVLDPEQRGVTLLLQQLEANLDWDRLNAEDESFLRRVTGLDTE